MFLAILLAFLAVGFAVSTILLIGMTIGNKKLFEEKNRLWSQLRNLDSSTRSESENTHCELTARMSDIKRLTDKLIEVQNNATLIEKDAKARIDEFKKQPVIACMTDNQVQILAEMVASHVRQILEAKKEYIN